MTRWRWYSLLTAILLGAFIAGMAWPALRMRQAVEAVASTDAAQREMAWARLMPALSDPAKSRRLLERIHSTLHGASEEALRGAGAALRRLDLWGWGRQPDSLILKEVHSLSSGAIEADQRLAASMMTDCPLDLDETTAIETFNRLLVSPHQIIRLEAFDAACGWAGLDRIEAIAELNIPADDFVLKRRYWLALSWGDDIPLRREPAPVVVLDVAEARILALVRTSGDAPKVNVEADLLIPWAYILAQSGSAKTIDLLTVMADRGDEAARFALRARRPELETDAARQMVLDASEPAWRRRLAAWRCDEIEDGTLRTILDLEPAGPDDHVFTTALLAERRLPPDAASDLARDWITDFNDDRKRAGSLLAALLGEHAGFLREAYEVEDMPRVRTVQRLALWALGEPVGDQRPVEFAFRSLHGDDGDFNPDTVLCMLIAGHVPALELLTTPPPVDGTSSITRRAWLIERFVPVWHRMAGRPIGGDARAVRLHFDSLDALRSLTRRRLQYDREARRFVFHPATG